MSERASFNLQHKAVVVSGGASGIGDAVCRQLVEEGARPVSLDVRASTAGGVHSVICDVSEPDAISSAFSDVVSKLGSVQGAVASAGIRNFGVSTELSAADWRRVIDINLSGVFYFSSAAARAMTTSGAGAIVTLSSVAAFGGLPQRINYCAAKAGVVGITKTMAVELAQQGIRVNSVAPGAVDTPMRAQNTAAQQADMLSLTPLGRVASPREISNVILFLLSDLSSFITGETIVADGGWTTALI